MALTYAERFKLITDTVLSRRVSVAVWQKALAVLDDAASTVDQKAEARARLKRPANEVEARIALIRIAADAAIAADPTDAELQAAVNKAYNQLPAP